MNRAKQLRVDRGLTLDALSDKTGVSYRTLKKIEAGTEVNAPALATLGRLYDVQPSSLYLPPLFDDERQAA
jgi:transcriptional regulator with XRE-family HTH domain